MRKPIYHYPNFVSEVTLDKTDTKRYWLNLNIDDTKDESIIVILKNPSRANETISDKTVFNVTNYIYKNRDTNPLLENIGNVIILNLIPYYETYSDKLHTIETEIIDEENLRIIDKLTAIHSKVIIAWGNAPNKLESSYNTLVSVVNSSLIRNNNQVFYVDRLSKKSNPKHGQIWGYADKLLPIDIKSFLK